VVASACSLAARATDFVIMVMNPRGAIAILHNKVKLGADASAAAGPKGRDASAETDVTLRAEMLTYSRSRGLFAGVSLEGSTLRPDNRRQRIDLLRSLKRPQRTQTEIAGIRVRR
jgi:lipid-binding SYLF domain-containing protein